MTRYNDTDITQVHEVREFMHVQAELDRLKQKHPEVFKELTAIAESYNQKLDAADSVCRARGISCGPFEFYQKSEKMDWDGLYDDTGREVFINAGGEIKTITVKNGDKAKVKAAAERGVISKDTLRKHLKSSARYHKPSKIELP